MGDILVGVTRPNLGLGLRIVKECTDGWFMYVGDGTIYGNVKPDAGVEATVWRWRYCDRVGHCKSEGRYDQGDRVGVLLDLNNGSLLFFKNGVEHGPGYPAGSVTGPVVAALEMEINGNSVRLHANAAFPAGHAQ
jgi:hypothetical protein